MKMLPTLLANANNYSKDVSHMADGQKPHTLFIACIDSRVIPNELLDTAEGEMLVVRNIANQMDLAAIEFSMSKNCESIIVCGHFACGGISVALGEDCLSAVDDHVRPIRKLWKKHSRLIRNQPMVLEWLNVLSTVKDICKIPIVRKKLEYNSVQVCGMYFDIKESKIIPLTVVSSLAQARSFNIEDEIKLLLDNLEDH